MLLSAKISKLAGAGPFVVRIADLGSKPNDKEALLLHANERASTNGFKCIFRIGDAIAPDEILIPKDLKYLGSGDIVRVNPNAGEVRVLYRRSSAYNTLF